MKYILRIYKCNSKLVRQIISNIPQLIIDDDKTLSSSAYDILHITSRDAKGFVELGKKLELNNIVNYI